MELRHLRYFVMAAEERNISRASARLNISQPAVSRQIKDLEDELGVELFARKRDGLELTAAGERALEHAREVLRKTLEMEEAMASLRETGKTLSIRIGYLAPALPGFLAESLREFTRKFPRVCVQIREMPPIDQVEALDRNELELTLMGSPGADLKKRLATRALRRTPMAIILPDDHRLAARKSLNLTELGDERFVTLHERQFPGRPEMMRDLFERAGIDSEVVAKADGLSELLGLVAAGTGVALAPADLNVLPHTGVRFVKMKKPTHTLVFSAAWKEERETPELLALIDMMEGR